MENSKKMTLSVDELAEALGISRTYAYYLMCAEGFPSIKLGKRRLVTKEALSKWLEEQQQKKGA